MNLLGVYSPRGNASTTSPRGNQWWRRDVFHLTHDKLRTLCGRDCSDYGVLADADTGNVNCCERCKTALARETTQ